MARSRTEHFDPSKPPKQTEHYTPESDVGPPPSGSPQSEPSDSRQNGDDRPRRRRARGVGVLRQSRLPEVGRLLIMAAWMRDSPPPDAERATAFRERLCRDIDQLRDKLSESELGPDDGELCAYFVACAIDNAALNGPYRDAWRENQIAAQLFDSAHGGEGFFERVKQVVYAPPGDYSTTVVEVALLCLVCGFEGRYASRESRDRDLARLKDEILTLLQESGRDDTSAFHKGNVEPRDYVPEKGFPVWGTLLAGLMAVGVLLVGFKLALSAQGNYAMERMATLGERIPSYVQPAVAAPTAPIARPAPPPAWIELLRSFCSRNELECDITAAAASITLGGADAFASASADLSGVMVERLRGLGTILDQATGTVTVEGHSDKQPIRSFRFQNNLHLSQERAKSVANLLTAELSQPGRVFTKGIGEMQPLCEEDGADCDARNRRVVIRLAGEAP